MIHAEELQTALVASGIQLDSIYILDEEYIMTTPRWITKDLSASMNKFFFDTGIKYQYDQYDCNKFAKTASTIADWCWAKTMVREAALAFGMFAYMSWMGPHMVNIAVHRNEQGKLYVAFYEPEPSAPSDHDVFSLICLLPKTLDEESIRTSFYCLFL